MKTLQFTLFSITGDYKPMSTLITVDSVKYYNAHSKEVQQQAIQKICNKRRMTAQDLKRYSYTQIKVRVYDKEKIAKEKAENYEKIKAERGWK